MEGVAAETLLCDTSFVGHYSRSTARPDRYQHWPKATLKRLGNAQLAITPFTLGEARAGYVHSGWGQAHIAAFEGQLASFLLIPLDGPTLDEYANLHAHCKSSGKPLHHNDLWIAAAAISRGLELVSCDAAQCALPGVQSIYLPPPGAATPQ
jgi:predicted nucleic acid-binding protein